MQVMLLCQHTEEPCNNTTSEHTSLNSMSLLTNRIQFQCSYYCFQCQLKRSVTPICLWGKPNISCKTFHLFRSAGVENALFSLVLFLHKQAFSGKKAGIKTFLLSRWKQTPELESGREVELLDLSSIRSPGESHSSGYSSYAAVELA